MWCPDGYVTLSEARTAALKVAREMVYPQYGDPADIIAFSETVPPGASDFAWSTGSWLFQDLLRRKGWGASTTKGIFVRLPVDSLMEVGDFSGLPVSFHQPYNPITTIGPPSPEWLAFYGRGYFERFTLVNFDSGTVRPSVPWTCFKSWVLSRLFPLFPDRIGLHHIARAIGWRTPFWIAWKLRGRAICLKSSDLEEWTRSIREYLAAFMDPSTGASDGADILGDAKVLKIKGRKPTTRKEVARALIELFGPTPGPISGWKETAKRVEAIINRSVSESTLRRAFEELRDR